MSDTEKSGLDPRFDPAFQRGFDGPQPRVMEPPARLKEPTGGAAPLRAAPAPFDVGSTARPAGPTAVGDGAGGAAGAGGRMPETPEFTESASDAEDAGREPNTVRGNPWLRTLWLIAVVFTIGGLAAQWQAQLMFASSNPSNVVEYYVIPSILGTMSPWFTFAGLFAGIGAVFISAAKWRAA